MYMKNIEGKIKRDQNRHFEIMSITRLQTENMMSTKIVSVINIPTLYIK